MIFSAANEAYPSLFNINFPQIARMDIVTPVLLFDYSLQKQPMFFLEQHSRTHIHTPAVEYDAKVEVGRREHFLQPTTPAQTAT